MTVQVLESRICLDCSAGITFSVGQAPPEVEQAEFDAAIEAAVAAWDAVGRVERVDAPGQDFFIGFDDIDGPDGLISTSDNVTVLLDSSEPWEFGNNNTLAFDMARALAHEIGHVAFGLEHSDNPDDLMFPFQTPDDALTEQPVVDPEPDPVPDPIPEPIPEPMPEPMPCDVMP